MEIALVQRGETLIITGVDGVLSAGNQVRTDRVMILLHRRGRQLPRVLLLVRKQLLKVGNVVLIDALVAFVRRGQIRFRILQLLFPIGNQRVIMVVRNAVRVLRAEYDLIPLVQAVRIEIAGEVEAQLLYEAHAAATDDEVACKVFSDIADEEKEHMGELLALLQYLDSEEADHMAEGVGEVEGMMKELGIDPSVASDLMGSVIRNDEGTEKELDAGRNSKE